VPKGRAALAGVSLEIAQGEFFGLLGPNGAGKTTLISILAGLTIATSGAARVMGHDVRADYREARRALGVVPQELVFDPFFTVREALTYSPATSAARQPRLDRRGDAPPRPHRTRPTPTCARSPAA
jgi:ABC-type multidrug transport system ATPase subunit